MTYYRLRQILATRCVHIRRKKVAPLLNEVHIAYRLAWCQTYKDDKFGHDLFVHIDVDEKQFYAKQLGGNLYVPRVYLEDTDLFPHICDEATINVQSKTNVPKVMFFGAMARPRPEYAFDGRILLKAVKVLKTAQKTSVNWNKGDKYYKYITEDKAMFCDLVRDTYDAAKTACPWATAFCFQYDGAGSHGTAALNEELNQWGSGQFPPVTFVQQPPQSPSLNALDLGAWFSLAAGVDEVRYEADATARVQDR